MLSRFFPNIGQGPFPKIAGKGPGFSYLFLLSRDTIDAVKQSAALTLLRLLRSSPDIIQMGEWTSRIIHLLNDQHMVMSFSALGFE